MFNNLKKKVLIASPVHRKATILREFLFSLQQLEQDSLELGFLFVDDNEEQGSSDLLHDFVDKIEYVTVLQSENHDSFICDDDTTHLWNEHLIWKVAGFKNVMIQRAIELHYDYLFLVDSDILLYPKTVKHLIETNKDIVSEIFWTNWWPGSEKEPQVWLADEFTQWHKSRGENLTDEEISKRKNEFFNQFKAPGVYEVGGLGACTLISRRALISGVNFNEIKNLSFFGEDRHFCIRAASLGFQLFVDTHYPAYHIYRESDLVGARTFLQQKENEIDTSYQRKSSIAVNSAKYDRPTLTLSMIVKNEADRYLKEVLQEHRKYIDQAVIIDDGSADHTIDLCLNTLEGIPVHLVQNEESQFNI